MLDDDDDDDAHASSAPLSSQPRNSNNNLPPLELWSLVTDTTLFKYTPVLAWIYLFLTLCGFVPQSISSTLANGTHNGDVVVLYRLQQPALNWRAMASHTSQFVWYRRLFVVFSCYTYVNTLKRIERLNDEETR